MNDKSEYFEKIVKESPDGICVANHEGKLEFVNEAFARILGWPVEELSGKHFTKVVPQEHKKFACQKLNELKHGAKNSFVIVTVKKDGSKIYIHDSSTSFEIDGLMKYSAIIKDVTDIIKRQEDLDLNEGFYKTLLDILPQKIFFKDVNGVCEMINQRYAEEYNVDPAYFIGKTAYDYYPKEMADKYRRDELEVMEKDKTVRTEDEYISATGEKQVMETVKAPVKDKCGNIIGVLGIFWDITERKRMEEALKESEEKYRDLFENAKDAMCIIDTEGHLKIINNNVLDILGGTKEEVVGSHISAWLAPESLKVAEEMLGKQIAGESEQDDLILEVVCKDGKHIWVDVRARPIKEGDRITGIHGTGRDITEKRILEQKLRESEERYRTLVEKSPILVYIVQNGKIKFVNKALLEKFGYTEEELYSDKFDLFSSLIAPEQRDLIRKYSEERARGREVPQEYELCLLKKDGTRLNFINYIQLIDYQGKKAYLGVLVDITDRKKAEEALRESEEKYRELFENANDAIFTTDTEGYIQKANNATVRICECTTKDEVIGTHYSDWLTPESLNDAENSKRKYISGEPVKQPVVRGFISKNGEHRWAEITSRLIYEEGKPVGLHCIARDLTEKIKLEQKLKASEERYRNLFENARDAMCIIDMEGRLIDVNHSMHRVLESTKEELIGSNISSWLTPESLRAAKKTIKKQISGETREKELIVEIVNKNGEHRWLDVRYRIIKEGNRILGIHCSGRDITEKRRLEKQLTQSIDKLHAVNNELKNIQQQKSDFISEVSQELLTPVQSLNKYINLLKDQIPANSDQEKILESIIRNSKNLESLIGDLADYTRMERNEIRITIDIVSLTTIVSNVVDDLVPLAKEKDIGLVTEAEEGVRIKGDEKRLVQVLTSILKNSIKFAPPGSTVRIILKENENDVHVRITAPGMALPDANRVFERLNHAENSNISGLSSVGLSICKEIIEKHNGRIFAESDDAGSIFNISFPKLSDSKTIVVIDDDPGATSLIQLILESKGYEVITFNDGKSAIESIHAIKPVLVLLDVVMPGMDGWDVLSEIKMRSKIPVIMLSVNRYRSDIPGIRPDDYITKPFDIKDITMRVERFVKP